MEEDDEREEKRVIELIKKEKKWRVKRGREEKGGWQGKRKREEKGYETRRE